MKNLFKDKRSIYNPFLYIAGGQALAWGLLFMLITALLGYLNNFWQDGLIDLHFGPEGPFWVHLVMVFVNWLSVVVILTPLALWLSDSRIRFIDLAGTLALARFPMVFALLTGFSSVPEKMVNYAMYTFLGQGEPVIITATDAIMALIMLIMVLLCIVWMVALNYHAYRISANLKGSKAGISFAAGYFIAYIISKIVASLLFMFVS